MQGGYEEQQSGGLVHGSSSGSTGGQLGTGGRQGAGGPQGSTAGAEGLLSFPAGSPASLSQVTEVAGRLARAMNSVIEGKPDVVHTAITVLLAEGHLLLEDVPGVG